MITIPFSSGPYLDQSIESYQAALRSLRAGSPGFGLNIALVPRGTSRIALLQPVPFRQDNHRIYHVGDELRLDVHHLPPGNYHVVLLISPQQVVLSFLDMLTIGPGTIGMVLSWPPGSTLVSF